MARPLAKAGGIAKGVAKGMAGFMDMKKSFDDAMQKRKWEKEKQSEDLRTQRGKAALGAGYQPKDMAGYLASGRGGEWTATHEMGGAGEPNFAEEVGGLSLSKATLIKVGDRLQWKPTYGQAIELNSLEDLEAIIGDPIDKKTGRNTYDMNTEDVSKMKKWIGKQIKGRFQNRLPANRPDTGRNNLKVTGGDETEDFWGQYK